MAFLRPALAAVALALCGLLFATTATAEAAKARPPAPPVGWQTQLGIGTIVNPEYVGSDEYQIIPIPYFDFRYLDERGTKFFANVPQGVGGYFYRQRDRQRGRRLDLGLSLAPGFNVRGDEIEGLDYVAHGERAYDMAS